jgi:hypothetical protein
MGGEGPVILESPFLRVEISGAGCYAVLDKETQVTWHTSPRLPRGGITILMDGRTAHIPLDQFRIRAHGNRVEMRSRSSPGNIVLTIAMELMDDGRTIELSYESERGRDIENIRLIDDCFGITDAEGGYVIVPVREGLMIPSNSGLAFTRRFGTFEYEGCHMEMLGAVKNGSAIMVTWHDPYIVAEVRSSLLPAMAGVNQILSLSLDLAKTARAVEVKFLGKGDYTSIAKGYREVVERKGWLVTWKAKLGHAPRATMLFGASNFKLWSCLERLLDEHGHEKSVTVNWTFQEAAEIAEHLRNDLDIRIAIFIIGGWIHRGYDNQHPDILPANPECGGDEGLAKAAQRIKNLGYLFCLHDNYQDIYGDSPSWGEGHVLKNADGSLCKGGFWAGGQAWIVCSKRGLELAQRPQNLPGVKRLYNPNAYFNDTTFAAGLYDCSDPSHPLTKWDDIKNKQALSDYTMSLFGVYGSECGREWAIGHSHFFEGLAGVGGRYYHTFEPSSLGARVIPIFEMVYRDCIAVYGKYDYDYSVAAEYVLHHILIGRPLHYHSWKRGPYWKEAPEDEPLGQPYGASCFIRADGGWAEGLCLADRFIKNTHEVLSPLHEATAQTVITKHEFLTPDRRVERVAFGGDAEAIVNKGTDRSADYLHSSRMGGKVLLPPFGFVIESPTFIAFHALSWNGREYNEPALFTIRSLDGKPLHESNKMRIFHGFGGQNLQLRGRVFTVRKEMISGPTADKLP